MSSLLARRLLQLIPTVILLSMIIFSLQHLLPGDPALVLAGENPDEATLAAIRAQYHLDQPLIVQYLYWVKGVVIGDLGEIHAPQPPGPRADPAQAAGQPCSSAVMGILIALVRRHCRRASSRRCATNSADRLRHQCRAACRHLGAELLARHHADHVLLGQSRLAAGLRLRQPLGRPEDEPRDDDHAGLRAGHRRSPASSCAIPAAPCRRRCESDYVRTARAKGLSEWVVVFKHAMRNALTPIITLGALEFGALLSGAVLTEQIFTIPGFGKLIVDAVFTRDYPVVQGVVLVTSLFYIVLNLLADIGLHPRQPKIEKLTVLTISETPTALPLQGRRSNVSFRGRRVAAPVEAQERARRSRRRAAHGVRRRLRAAAGAL